MPAEPKEFFEDNQSVDFEIALTALIASTASLVPKVLGKWSFIPIGLGLGLLLLTLVRKMLMMVDENEAFYLNFSMYFIGLFSAISVTYILYSISVSASSLVPIPTNPLDLMAGLSLFLVFESLVFHILITKDFPDYLYFTVQHKIRSSHGSLVGVLLGTIFDYAVVSQIKKLPEALVSDRLKDEVEGIEFQNSTSKSFFWSSVGILLASALLTVFLHFLNLSIARYAMISLIPMLILIPLRMWYVVYGNAKPDQIFGIWFYFSILVLNIIFLLVAI